MRKYGLSGNMLKCIAAVFMVIDHVGVILFPQVLLLRMLGRISFPIFAFMIAQGCRYTRNRCRYFLTMFGVGAVCQAVVYYYNGSRQLNILLTFSLSVLLVFSFDWFKEQIFAEYPAFSSAFLGAFLLVLLLTGVAVLDQLVDLDYGGAGCMVPLFAALLHPPKRREGTALHRIDHPFVHVLAMLPGLVLLSMADGGIQYFCLLSLPLLLFYSGKRGKRKMKYFFYVFYPAHLLLIQGVAFLFF